ncbi:MAG: hypothetical protein Q4G46_16405 [Propionibacteriaceae bacterium]|nr:hypothetical protein [Propionibacteriaceae bacterium]
MTTLRRYRVTAADAAAMPAALATEARYLGYRADDLAKPYASFFRPDMLPVPERVAEAIVAGMAPTEYHVDLNSFADELSKPGYSSLEDGWTRRGGTTYVAVRTEMPGVTAQMWEWWFGWHSTESARYKLWYPDAHQFAGVGEDRSADRGLTDRQRYIDNVSYVDEYIGGRLQKLAIRFFDPQRVGLADRPGWTHICARVGFNHLPLVFGWLVHQVRPTESGSEMRSRFCLNDPAIVRLPRGSQLAHRGTGLLSAAARLGLESPSPRLTRRALPDSIGGDMVYHCSKEMNHLASLLPELHAAFAGTP